jgi:hypothetical protein
MTISKPCQPELFASGSPEPLRTVWPTPTTQMGKHAGPTEWEMENRPGHLHVLANSRSSPAAIPASHSRSPGSAWARRMTAISGRSLRPWLPTSSLAAVFSRMFTDTSRWGSTRCWLTWRRSATPAGRPLFLLRPSAPRTGEIASGFWPTPRASENENRQTKPTPSQLAGTPGRSLAAEVTMWPTPKARDWKNTGGPAELLREGPDLNVVVERMLPTPRHEGFDAGGHRGTNDSLHSAVKATTTGKLSAAWTAALMGYSPTWLDLED